MRLRFLWLPVIIVMATISSCTGFRLAEVSADQIPADIREWCGEKDVIWRACYQQDGYTVVWYEAQGPVGGLTMYKYMAYARDETGQLRSGSGGSSGGGGRYSWGTGRGGDQDCYCIHAEGTAFSSNAKRAIGFLTDGQTCEGPVVNGFWYLRVDEPMGDFLKVEIWDGRGRAIHTFERPL